MTLFNLNLSTEDVSPDRRIGRGSYGTIFELDRYTVLKKIEAVEGHETLIEVDLLLRLNHPNLLHGHGLLLPVHGDEIFSRRAFGVVLPRYDGSLQEIFRLPSLDYTTKRRVFIDICRGVQHLHRNKVAHLDLKLPNILYRLADGDRISDVAVADFGMSKVVDSGGRVVSGSPLVTVTSRPPENLSGSDLYGLESDIWSLGILALQLLGSTQPKADFLVKMAGSYRRLRIDDPRRRDFRATEDFRLFLGTVLARSVSRETFDLFLERNTSDWANDDRRSFAIRSYFSPSVHQSDPDLVDLVIDLLQLNPSKRPKIDEVLGRLGIESVHVELPIIPLPEPSDEIRRIYEETFLGGGSFFSESLLAQAERLYQRCDGIFGVVESSSDLVEKGRLDTLLRVICLWLIEGTQASCSFSGSTADRMTCLVSDLFGWDAFIGENLESGWDLVDWTPGEPIVPSSLIIAQRMVLRYVGGIFLG